MCNNKASFFYLQKTSRAGWQSPQDNDLSSKPKSDDYPHRHTVRSSTSPKKMLHKRSSTLEKNNSSNHLHPNYQQYSKSVDHNKFSKAIEQRLHHNRNDSTSDMHNFCQNNYSHNNLNTSNYPTSSSLAASSEVKSIQYENISSMDQSRQIMSNNATGNQIKENQFSAKSLSRRGGNSVDTMVKINKFEHDKITSAKKRDEYQPDTINGGKFYSKQSTENAENLYGKIQSRTFPTSSNSIETPSLICGGNYDRCNANVHLKSGMKRCDNSNGVVMNFVNNNPFDGGQLHHLGHHNGNHNSTSDNLSNEGYADKNIASLGQPNNSTISNSNIRRTSGEKSRNMLRTNRYSNGSHLVAPGTNSSHQLAHMINTLSSPESAYSTGYSTDGTSPGKSIFYLIF